MAPAESVPFLHIRETLIRACGVKCTVVKKGGYDIIRAQQKGVNLLLAGGG